MTYCHPVPFLIDFLLQDSLGGLVLILAGIKPVLRALRREEFLMGALLDNLSVVHDQNQVGVADS